MRNSEEGGSFEDEDGEHRTPDYGAKLGADNAQESCENPHIGSSESKEIDSATAYEFAYQLANAGRVDSLDMQRDYLLEHTICTENELDELMVLCLTIRIGQLINMIDVIDNQVAHMKKELGSHITGDDDIKEIQRLMTNLHYRRSDTIEGIRNRGEGATRLPIEEIHPDDFGETAE